MQPIQVARAGDSRLRFVFNDAVVSFSLAANATFEDIARTLGQLPNRRYGNPVAIDVILGLGADDTAHRMLAANADWTKGKVQNIVGTIEDSLSS